MQRALIRLIRTRSSNPDFRQLILELDNDLNERYQTEQSKYDKHNVIDIIETVVLGYEGKIPVTCGCFKKYGPDSVEIKRMYVKPSHRGRGLSKLVLAELEFWAVELGNKTAVLETGKGQPEAIGLYQNSGYQQIDNYGPYKNIPQSICFEKRLMHR